MENSSYHIRNVDAIEIIEDQIHDWQKNEPKRRLVQMKTNPSAVLSEKDFLGALNVNEKKSG